MPNSDRRWAELTDDRSPLRARRARAPEHVRRLLETRRGPAEVIGAFPEAIYLRLPGPRPVDDEVIAVATPRAVAVPIALVLEPGDEFDLSTVTGPAEVARRTLSVGELTVHLVGDRPSGLPLLGRPDPELIAQTQRALGECVARRLDLPQAGLLALGSEPWVAVATLLGRGPGLTPSGDDVLAGYLAGEALFGGTPSALAGCVHRRLAGSAAATTSLSRALLRRAIAGEGPPQLAELGRSLIRPDGTATGAALTRVLSIGHSSGLGLAVGLLAAALDRAQHNVDLPTMGTGGPDTTERTGL